MIREWFINFLDKSETKRSDGKNKSIADKREIQMSIYYKELALLNAKLKLMKIINQLKAKIIIS